MTALRRPMDLAFNQQEDAPSKKILEPLRVVEGFGFSPNFGKYPAPFVTKEEDWHGLLNGSEYSVLYSADEETIYSHDFVQCGGALVRNRRTGIVFLIHESSWSVAAQTILEGQQSDDLDVIIMNSRSGHMRFDRVRNSHKGMGMNGETTHPDATVIKEGEEHWMFQSKGGKYIRDDQRVHLFRDGSRISGLTLEELIALHDASQKSTTKGDARLIGEIKLPKTVDKWSLTYRPKENVILIYSFKTNELFFYPAFPPLKKA